jgi:general secretion pathway protein A
MYTQKFGLKLDPFSIAPDPRFLFMSERHREALAHLLWGVSGQESTAGTSGGGFVLLTGDIGAGKTTICRCFLQQIPAHCNVGYIFNPKLSVIDLLESICEEFDIKLPSEKVKAPTAKAYIDALNTYLLDRHAAWESCVLIIDEAQNLAPEVLEQLRLLTNLETAERKLLQIILIGQPELRDMLARPDLEQLAQRVIARCHLDALNATETKQYIAHRMAVAGLTEALPFDAPALKRIHELTRGVPRRINLLCGRALLGAWAAGDSLVKRSTVNRAAAEVFDTKLINKGNSGPRRTRMALTALMLLLAAAAGALAVWTTSPKPLPNTTVNTPASAPGH